MEKVLQLRLKSKNLTCGDEYFCELTDEMNNHLIPSLKECMSDGYLYSSYLMEYDKNIYCIRVPGATRGHIRFDDNKIITKIEFYEDTCFGEKLGCFSPTLKTLKDKYLGYKIVL